MPSLNKNLSEMKTVNVIDETGEKWIFQCKIPSLRIKSRALEVATGRNGKTDAVKFNKHIFSECVQSWNLDEECTQANRIAMFESENSAINEIAVSVVNALVQDSNETDAEIQGN